MEQYLFSKVLTRLHLGQSCTAGLSFNVSSSSTVIPFRDRIVLLRCIVLVRFERYLDLKMKYSVSHKPSNSTGKLVESISHVALRSKEQSMLLDPSFKHGIIAIMLNNILAKHDQQGTSFISRNAFNLLSDSNLKLIEPAEQASVCHKCLNFEQIVGTYPCREPKCSKCLQDNLTVRVFVLLLIVCLFHK